MRHRGRLSKEAVSGGGGGGHGVLTLQCFN